MALQIERVVDGVVDGNEALSLALGFEPLHLSLPSSDGKVRVFDPVVTAQSARMMKMDALQFLECGAVGGQSVSHDFLGNEALVLG